MEKIRASKEFKYRQNQSNTENEVHALRLMDFLPRKFLSSSLRAYLLILYTHL